MIFRHILMALVTAAMFAAGSAVAVVALAFALYTFVEPRLGRAGAAATVAVVVVALMVVGGLAVVWAGRKKPSKTGSSTLGGTLKQGLEFLQRKPVVAATSAVWVGIMAFRNPKYLGSVLRAFLDGQPPRK